LLLRIGLVYGKITEIAENYKVDPSNISVSGLSSGGVMATQMHVAYSSIFMGAGILSASKHYSLSKIIRYRCL